MATTIAVGASATLNLVGTEKITVTSNDGTYWSAQFTPVNQALGKGGAGRSYGPAALSIDLGPYGAPGTLVLTANSGGAISYADTSTVVALSMVVDKATSVPYAPALSDAGVAPPLPAYFKRKTGGKSFIWFHPSTSTDMKDAYVIAVPIGSGYYDVTVINKLAGTACPQIAKRFLGIAGAFKHHADGSGVTKTGTWANSSATYAPSGSTSQSSTAGDTIDFAVSGHTLVHRGIATTNGGYAVVAIDGDFTKANRLPTFTQADADSGLCRSTDVGKRYICSYGQNGFPDLHVPLAEGLTDGAHTVRFEITGTKPAASSAARAYIGGIVAASASDTTSDLALNTRMLGYVETVLDQLGSTSAMIYTPEVEKSVAGTFEFLGEVHGGETLESLTITVDGTDQTSMAIGTMVGGTVIKVDRVSTIANTDATGTPVCRKYMNLVASAISDCPLTIGWRAKWLVAKNVRYSYVMMLAFGKTDQVSNLVKQLRWDGGYIGTTQLSSGSFAGNDNSQRGNTTALYAVAYSSQHTRKSFAALMDGGRSVNFFVGSLPDRVFMHDRSDGYDKFYFCRSTSASPESFAVGDEIGGVVGFGIVNS